MWESFIERWPDVLKGGAVLITAVIWLVQNNRTKKSSPQATETKRELGPGEQP